MRFVVALLAVLGLGVVGSAEAAWSLDLASLTTDVTTIGAAILAVVAIIYGFGVVRRMIGK